ncbi:hypothetical protein R3P38DRAFT_3274523 [Favolaschia claudopus]|uniref:Uncharacterized protein n=1 Tax=Favolaschia claudopus TaxID=2862362 RepID=A0AAW0B035_9AGAR
MSILRKIGSRDARTGGVENESKTSSTEDPVASPSAVKQGSKNCLHPQNCRSSFGTTNFWMIQKTRQPSRTHYSRTIAKTPAFKRVSRKYKRVWPRFAPDTEPATAFTTAPRSNPQHHIRAHQEFPTLVLLASRPKARDEPAHRPHRSHSRPTLGPGEVIVAAKTGYLREPTRQLPTNEGRICGVSPKHSQEDWCGYSLVAPIAHPVPVGAVVPKFYGDHVPVMEDVEREKQETVRVRKETKRMKRKKREEGKKPAAQAGTAQVAKAEGAEVSKAEDEDSGATSEDDVAPEETVPAEDAQPSKGQAQDDGDDDEVEVSKDDAGEYDDIDELAAFRYFQMGASYEVWHQQSPFSSLENAAIRLGTPDKRSECYSSRSTPAPRGIHPKLVSRARQPGPLTVPPLSFRIINHGRGEYWQHKLGDLSENAK